MPRRKSTAVIFTDPSPVRVMIKLCLFVAHIFRSSLSFVLRSVVLWSNCSFLSYSFCFVKLQKMDQA